MQINRTILQKKHQATAKKKTAPRITTEGCRGELND